MGTETHKNMMMGKHLYLLAKYVNEFSALSGKKIAIILVAATYGTVVQKFIETYIYSDWDFLRALVTLIALDTITGVMKAWLKKQFSSYRLGQIIVKLALYAIALIAVHTLTTFTISGNHPAILDFTDDFMLTAMMVREAVSIFENIAIIKPDLLPRWILKRLESFDENGFEAKDDNSKPKE